MRDYAEIGIGRQARRTYALDDISIVPTRRTRSSKDVDTTWHIDAYTFDIPVMSQPTDALASAEFIEEFDRQGGLAVIDAEGLWGRHEDIDAAINKVLAKAGDSSPYDASNAVLQELHAAPLDEELLTKRIGEIREKGTTLAVRVSPQHARELAPVVVKAGADILVIQGTTISAEHVSADGEPLNLKDFVGDLDVPVIAGGVTDYTTAMHLMRTGAAGVIVGGGSTTNAFTLGLETRMATAIADVAAARRDYLDETGGRYVHVIAGAELYTSGDMAKAIACGADAVMLGIPLAVSDLAAGKGFYWEPSAAHPRFPRSKFTNTNLWSSTNATQVPLEQVLHGPSSEPMGGLNLVGGLRRAMAKCGYTDLKAFQKVDLALL